MIERSSFDSEVFGLSVGRVIIRAHRDLEPLSARLSDFDAIWVTVKSLDLVAPVCNLADVGVVDYRYDFAKARAGCGVPWPEHFPMVQDLGELGDLPARAFVTSRFSKDPRTAPLAGRLFQTWLEAGVQAGRVRVARAGSGFIFAEPEPDGGGRHVLAAVQPEDRARGLYRDMILASERAFPNGATARGKVPVDTFAPVRVLLDLGYRIHELEAVVHLWPQRRS